MEAPTQSPPASHRHRPRLREHSHSSSVFTGASCCSRSSTSAKLRAGGRGDGKGECESNQVVSGDAVRQSPGSTPLGRSILTRRVWRPGCGSARCASGIGEGVPRARGRRAGHETDPGGYYLCGLGGRGRAPQANLARAGGQSDRPSCSACRRRGKQAALRLLLRSTCLAASTFGFVLKGNVPSTHHSSAKGPAVRLNATTKTAQGPGPPGSSPAAARGNSTTQEDVRTGAAVPERRSGGAAERRTGLVIRNLGAGWDYRLQAVLCYMRPQESQQPDAAISFPRDSRVN